MVQVLVNKIPVELLQPIHSSITSLQISNSGHEALVQQPYGPAIHEWLVNLVSRVTSTVSYNGAILDLQELRTHLNIKDHTHGTN